MVHHGIEIPRERIAEFCRRHHIRKLSVFGSILCDEVLQEAQVLYDAA